MSLLGRMGHMTRRGYNAMIEARQKRAQHYVNGALLSFDDETLARAGFDRDELKRGAPGRMIF